MKFWKIFWGFGAILLAVLLLLNTLGVLTPAFDVVGGVSALQIVLALFVFAFLISRLIKLKFGSIFIPLSFLFMIFERNIAFALGLESENIINNWLLFFCALLISIGISLLIPSKAKRWKKHKKDRAMKSNRFASSTRYIDCESFVEEYIHNELGELKIYFENTDSFTSGAVINLYNRLGATDIYVPREWNVKENITNNLGDVSSYEKGDPEGPTLILSGHNELGAVSVKFI